MENATTICTRECTMVVGNGRRTMGSTLGAICKAGVPPAASLRRRHVLALQAFFLIRKGGTLFGRI